MLQCFNDLLFPPSHWPSLTWTLLTVTWPPGLTQKRRKTVRNTRALGKVTTQPTQHSMHLGRPQMIYKCRLKISSKSIILALLKRDVFSLFFLSRVSWFVCCSSVLSGCGLPSGGRLEWLNCLSQCGERAVQWLDLNYLNFLVWILNPTLIGLTLNNSKPSTMQLLFDLW